MEDSRQKFQELLRRLFQFESADLDFGIYRIMNYKRDVIEKFIDKDLLDAVSAELNQGALAEQKEAESKIQDIAAEIKDKLAEDAINGDGKIRQQYENTKLGQEYEKWKEILASYGKHAAHEPEIFNHLYTFFSRYYDNGDFMSKRRYSKKEKYAIPYNGEEIYLHWANSDQYYIKTGEYFTDFTFRSGDITVHFKMQAAQVEKENIKGDKRLFIPLIKQASYDAGSKQIVIPFEYRPLTEKETISYGQKNQQDAITTEALEKIPKQFKSDALVLEALMAERRRTSEGRSVSYLEHHLNQYASRNTSDFFIHKDLKGFLSRELDFYLKNEVLNLEELEASGETRTEGWFQMMRVIRNIGHKVIAFLATIEEFQKKLFEKKKFITDTQYCITMQNIPEEFYSEIAANDAQWAEWKEQLHIDEDKTDLFTSGKSKQNRRIDFLKNHPTLMIDTKYYDATFTDSLLASFNEMDDVIDGLLIFSENYQALNLLQERYRGQVQCIYIDPPYNTGSDEFIYKDRYQSSTWLAMMKDRLLLGKEILKSEGTFFTSIDHNEISGLKEILDSVFLTRNFEGLITWRRRHNQPNDKTKMIGLVSEYLLSYAKDSAQLKRAGVGKLDLTGDFSNPDNDPRCDWASKPWKVGADQSGTRYIITTPTGKKFDEEWMGDESTYKTLLADKRIIFPKGGDGLPRKKYFRFEREEEGQCATNWWEHSYFGHNAGANDTLTGLFGVKNLVSNPKPVELVRGVVQVAGRKVDLVVDFFAGSGTTGHAVINLNREEGVQRKFILIEMGRYFETVLLPRVKKVTFTSSWKDGKPLRKATLKEAKKSPRLVKYIKLESYDDALNNITFKAPESQKTFLFDDYLINYMIGSETKDSDTLLNIDKLASPFSYKLTVVQDGQSRAIPVDLMETFTYLLGLHVKKRIVFYDDKRRYVAYKGAIDSRSVVVIWRDIKDWTKDDFDRERTFIEKQKITEEADEIFVNGDSIIPNSRSLDPVFKSRMFAPIASSNGGF